MLENVCPINKNIKKTKKNNKNKEIHKKFTKQWNT